VLRRIFGPKRDEVTGEWRKLHSGELHNLYSSPDIIRQVKLRRMRWAGHVAPMGEGRNVYRVLMGTREGKRPLERPRSRWEDGLKMDLGEIDWGGEEWIHLAQDRDRWRAVVNAVMNVRVLAPRSYLVKIFGLDEYSNACITLLHLPVSYLSTLFHHVCI
jgi:hypothetical protein